MAKAKAADEAATADDGLSSWASRSNRFPQDQALRRRGYQIAARPAGAEAVWRAPGWPPRLVPHGEALAELDRAVAATLRDAEGGADA